MRPGSRYDTHEDNISPETSSLRATVPQVTHMSNLDIMMAPPRANSPPPPQMSTTSPVVAPRHQSRSGLPSSCGSVVGISRIGGASRVDATCVSDIQQAGMDLRQSMHATQAQQEGRLGREGMFTPEQVTPIDPISAYLFPSIPTGIKTLVFDIKSNWGDEYYVGLCGIEVYDGEGRRIVPGMTGGPLRGHHKDGFSVHTTFDLAARAGGELSSSSGSATAPLPTFLRESCVIGAADFSNVKTITSGSSAAQGGSRTKKGVTGMKEMFRMPLRRRVPTTDASSGSYNAQEKNLIWITFRHDVSVSLIRLYNYNAGRTHIAKGIRHLQIQDQNDRVLFTGEIACATGSSKNPPESILFASESDASVLATIVSQNDTEAERELEIMLEEEGALMRSFNHQNSGDIFDVNSPVRVDGASTGCESPTSKKRASRKQQPAAKSVSFAPGSLSKVCSAGPANANRGARRRSSLSRGGTSDFPTPAYPEDCPRNVVAVVFTLQSTWGDAHFVGLSGLRFFDGKGQRIFGIRSVAVLRPYLDDSLFPNEEEFQSALAFHREYDNEVSAVIDDDACTACVWRFQGNMQILVIMDEPKLMAENGLGCIQVANYCIQGSTQIGVKRAQVHVIASDSAEGAKAANIDSCVAVLNATINNGFGGFSAPSPSTSGLKVIPLTSEESPLILRKSPNQLNALKFQSFDVSLSYDSANEKLKETVSGPTAGGFLQQTSMTTSMTASVTVRANIEMKRARMFLLDPPTPSELPRSIAVAGCVLPLGYVFKLDVTLLLQISVPNNAETTQYATVSRCLKNVLKGVLLDADTAQESPCTSDNNVGYVNMYDEEGTLIDPELYTTGCSITSLEGINDISSHINSLPSSSAASEGGVRASMALDRQFRALEGPSSQTSSSAGTSRAGSLGGGASRRLHQHINNQQSSDNVTTFTTSTTVSLIFVFDIPTALSAVAYRFTGTERAGADTPRSSATPPQTAPGGAAVKCTVSSLSVLADDCIIYQSPDLADVADPASVGEEEGGGGTETPACVAFTYNRSVIQAIGNAHLSLVKQ